jgi:hypothetical protein
MCLNSLWTASFMLANCFGFLCLKSFIISNCPLASFAIASSPAKTSGAAAYENEK